MIKRESAREGGDKGGAEEKRKPARWKQGMLIIVKGRVQRGAAVSLPRSYSPFYTDFVVPSSPSYETFLPLSS